MSAEGGGGIVDDVGCCGSTCCCCSTCCCGCTCGCCSGCCFGCEEVPGCFLPLIIQNINLRTRPIIPRPRMIPRYTIWPSKSRLEKIESPPSPQLVNKKIGISKNRSFNLCSIQLALVATPKLSKFQESYFLWQFFVAFISPRSFFLRGILS
jgi:hypothetical protein